MKYPESYPEYIPKDKFAEWFEGYVAALDLAFWTSTELVSAHFDEELGRWDAEVRTEGRVRVMHPEHIVLATGGTTKLRVPSFPGLGRFSGETLAANEFSSGADFSRKRVLVVGVGVTAHDIAEDIVKHGGHVTLLQRSPQIIVDLPTANRLYGDYNGRIVPTELIDERFMSGMIYPVLRSACQMNQAAGEEQDKDLLDGLRSAGMKLWSGEDGTGWFFNFFKTYGGYYINVGASNMIIDGQIGLMQADDIDGFTPEGVKLKTGEAADFDAIVYATGYESPTVDIERLFGQEVVNKLGPVWGMGPDGELNNISKPTAQRGLWIMMGGIPTGRYFAPVMAVMIQAQLEGVFPESFQAIGHPSQTSSPARA